jgi:hypothetical protein
MDVYHLRMVSEKSNQYIKIKKEELSKYPMAVAHQKIKIA